VIEAVGLLESSRVIEWRTAGNHGATGDPFSKFERCGQCVLTTLGPPHDPNRTHLEVIEERDEVCSDPGK
jgi:hypothetical protein